MRNVSLLEEPREGQEAFRAFDPAAYTRKSFGMFGGREETVTLLCKDSFAGVIIDRFGKDVFMVPQQTGWFKTKVKVAVSTHFLSWVMALGEGVKIVGPDWVVEEMKGEIHRLQQMYLIEE